MHLTLRLHPHHAVVTVQGAVTDDGVHQVVDAFSMAPDDHPMVLDLVAVVDIDDAAVVELRREIARRSAATLVAIDSTVVEVAVRLVMNELDTVCTFVDGLPLALEHLDALLPR